MTNKRMLSVIIKKYKCHFTIDKPIYRNDIIRDIERTEYNPNSTNYSTSSMKLVDKCSHVYQQYVDEVISELYEILSEYHDISIAQIYSIVKENPPKYKIQIIYSPDVFDYECLEYINIPTIFTNEPDLEKVKKINDIMSAKKMEAKKQAIIEFKKLDAWIKNLNNN